MIKRVKIELLNHEYWVIDLNYGYERAGGIGQKKLKTIHEKVSSKQ